MFQTVVGNICQQISWFIFRGTISFFLREEHLRIVF